jgi:C-terminal processing protease CtpA/Prc
MKAKSNILMLLILISAIIFFTNISFAQTQRVNYNQEWTGSTEQKVFGLMTVWSEAKYNFPWFDKLPDLDWDAKVTEYIPRVIAAQDIDAYYKVLMEFVTLLKDGHTNIWPPWFPFKQTDDLPAIEVQIVENKFVVARVGEIEENKNQNIYPGLEILEVDSNNPIETYFKENVLRYNTTGTELGDQVLVWSIFVGQSGSKLSLKVKDLDGTIRNITIIRNSLASGTSFLPRFAMWNGFEKNIEFKTLPGGIQYVRIPNFTTESMVKEFMDMIDNLDSTKTKGMIIDLRYNSGGNDRNSRQMISCLIDKPINSPLLKLPQYIGAYRVWEKKTQPLETNDLIMPRSQKKYLGPLVVLTGIGTASTAEDFAIEMEFSGRALLVGERTPGSSGNPIHVPLPGGGTLRVATFKSYYPDGTEYMHSEVKPDVEVVTTQKNLYDGVEPIIEKGIEVSNNWTAFSKTTKKFKTSAVTGISKILNHKSYVNAKPEIDDILIHASEYYFLENEFINYGYDLIKKDRINDAAEIFKMTTELYPASWNAYDSYAEALMKKGENEGAIENYKKSLKLNPKNKNGEDMLKLLNDNK